MIINCPYCNHELTGEEVQANKIYQVCYDSNTNTAIINCSKCKKKYVANCIVEPITEVFTMEDHILIEGFLDQIL